MIDLTIGMATADGIASAQHNAYLRLHHNPTKRLSVDITLEIHRCTQKSTCGPDGTNHLSHLLDPRITLIQGFVEGTGSKQ